MIRLKKAFLKSQLKLYFKIIVDLTQIQIDM